MNETQYSTTYTKIVDERLEKCRKARERMAEFSSEMKKLREQAHRAPTPSRKPFPVGTK